MQKVASKIGDLQSVVELQSAAYRFQGRLREVKAANPLPAPGWYPYDTLAGVDILAPLVDHDFAIFREALRQGPVADIGCADADMSYFLASLGCDVDAIDNRETNYNDLRGAKRLQSLLDLKVNISECDLDSRFELPRQYKLAVFLGLLYHLKNPYYALETLANKAEYCVLSTRIAKYASYYALIERDPIAYLLDTHEANNDATNYWVFSREGLLRLAKRTGWQVLASRAVGNTKDSNPFDVDKDERLYLFMRSTVLNKGFEVPDQTVRPTEGWHPVEFGLWRWTSKRFLVDLTFANGKTATAFTLDFVIPDSVAGTGDVVLSCLVNGQPAGRESYSEAKRSTFSATFPAGTDFSKTMILEFLVEHAYHSPTDPRDLGVIIPCEQRKDGPGWMISLCTI